MTFLSSAVGAIGEAWAELRTHKLRVVLSLIGIAVAVGALTAVLALGEFQRQVVMEQSERFGGRAATLAASTTSKDGAPVDWQDADRRFLRVAERYGFSHTSRATPEGMITLPVQLPEGVKPVPARLMDPAYPVMHRITLAEGRWFTAGDGELLAPPVVISEPLWDLLGRIPLSEHPTLRLSGEASGIAAIIGVTPRQGAWDSQPRIDILLDHYRSRLGALPTDAQITWEAWVPPELADEIAPALANDLRASLPPGLEVTVQRTDWAAHPGFDTQFLVMQLTTGGIAGLVLLLGGLSLVNIQLVAMRQRIGEIGIRRSFGASGARIFASVMLESVVATAVAGILGIALAVSLLRSPWVMDGLFGGMEDTPAFPLSAAAIGLICSVAVGALAGVIPALVALRVRVIDAIRF